MRPYLPRKRNVVRVDCRPAATADDLGDLAAVVRAVGDDLREDIEDGRDHLLPLARFVAHVTGELVFRDARQELGIAALVFCEQRGALVEVERRPNGMARRALLQARKPDVFRGEQVCQERQRFGVGRWRGLERFERAPIGPSDVAKQVLVVRIHSVGFRRRSVGGERT